MGRCLLVGASVTLGFLAVFAAFGVLVRQFSVSIGAFAPYLTLGLGILMIPLGLFLLRGRQIKLRLPTVAARTAGSDPPGRPPVRCLLRRSVAGLHAAQLPGSHRLHAGP